jgi:hypothetical protein
MIKKLPNLTHTKTSTDELKTLHGDGVLSCEPKDKAGGQPLVGCPPTGCSVHVHLQISLETVSEMFVTTRLAMVTLYNRPMDGRLTFVTFPEKTSWARLFHFTSPALQWICFPISDIYDSTVVMCRYIPSLGNGVFL